MSQENQSTIEQLGEIYGYFSSLKDDYIEYGKITLTQKTASVVGLLSVAAILMMFFMLFLVAVIIGLVVAMYTYLQNPVLLIFGSAFVFLLLGLIVYRFRKTLIIIPIGNLLYKSIED